MRVYTVTIHEDTEDFSWNSYVGPSLEDGLSDLESSLILGGIQNTGTKYEICAWENGDIVDDYTHDKVMGLLRERNLKPNRRNQTCWSGGDIHARCCGGV